MSARALPKAARSERPSNPWQHEEGPAGPEAGSGVGRETRRRGGRAGGGWSGLQPLGWLCLCPLAFTSFGLGSSLLVLLALWPEKCLTVLQSLGVIVREGAVKRSLTPPELLRLGKRQGLFHV